MNDLLSQFSGMPVYVNEMAVNRQQYKFPRSKKKRIRNKWAKNDKNFKLTPAYFIVAKSLLQWGSLSNEKCVVIHPALMVRMKSEMKRQMDLHNQKWG